MALKLLQPGVQPLGQWDGVDSQVSAVKGGEVVSFTYLNLVNVLDLHAADANDGYVGTTNKSRPAVTNLLVSGMRPLMLCDDGTAGYGTLFGQLIGGTAGQTTTLTGTQLGPSSAAASGKITCWDKPGFYAVTLDACDPAATTGLQPTNTTLAGGAPLYATSAGLLTPNVAVAFESIVVGRFIEFSTNGSLVTTPQSLAAAVNSPESNVSSLKSGGFTQAVFSFWPGQ